MSKRALYQIVAYDKNGNFSHNVGYPYDSMKEAEDMKMGYLLVGRATHLTYKVEKTWT